MQANITKMQTREQRTLQARDALMQAIIKWGLVEDGETITRHSSLLQPVIFEDTKAMLKVVMKPEERRVSALMICWDGKGAVKVLKHADEVLLLERAVGPESAILSLCDHGFLISGVLTQNMAAYLAGVPILPMAC